MRNLSCRLLAFVRLSARNKFLYTKTLSLDSVQSPLHQTQLHIQQLRSKTRNVFRPLRSAVFVNTFTMASEQPELCVTEKPENTVESVPKNETEHMNPIGSADPDVIDDNGKKDSQVTTQFEVDKSSVSEAQNEGENSKQTQNASPDDTTQDDPIEDIGIKPPQTSSKIASAADDIRRSLTRKGKKRKSPGLHMTFKKARLASNETMSETKYYFENGLRKVYPYDHRFNTFCKGRWIGKTLREIYSSEFRLYPIEHYEKAMKDGRLMVNLKRPTSIDQIVQNNDLISSTVHRHECPVTDARIEVIEDNDNFFVINKPASIPLHPGGRFRHNTVLSILAKEMRKTDLSSVHRLDRMTSGLLMFVKNKETASKVHRHIRERQVEKEYVCRVAGDFSKFTLGGSTEHRITVREGDCPEIAVDEPLKVYDYKVGTSIVSHDDDAKDCQTVFKCKYTDGKTSVVSCKPKTGRTHQIRVHLQYLGYPIVNDQVYNSPAWGEERFKLGPITKSLEVVMEELVTMKKWLADMESAENLELRPEAEVDGAPALDAEDEEEVIRRKGDIVVYRSTCAECKKPLPDPTPNELVMHLHALKYKGPDWEFETPLPKWAEPDWVEQKAEDDKT